jgi:hypothetical protein
MSQLKEKNTTEQNRLGKKHTVLGSRHLHISQLRRSRLVGWLVGTILPRQSDRALTPTDLDLRLHRVGAHDSAFLRDSSMCRRTSWWLKFCQSRRGLNH